MTRFHIREKLMVLSVLVVLTIAGSVAMCYGDQNRPVDF